MKTAVKRHMPTDMNAMEKSEMHNLNNNSINILNLPNEILCIIFQKLNTVYVFYSLLDVNQRFRQLILDSLHIRDLDMTNMIATNSFCHETFPIDTKVLSRICKKILPRIHHQVQKLTVGQCSMKEVLATGNFPQLYSLSLINFEEHVLYQYLTDDLTLRNLLTKQITHLNIDIKPSSEPETTIAVEIFKLILCLGKSLMVLNFSDMFHSRSCIIPSLDVLWKDDLSSTLTKLKIKVESLDDCIYLLYTPLICLSTLIIDVSLFLSFRFPDMIDPTKKLLKLKCFSLTTVSDCYTPDTQLAPLLRRMVNLEELKLSLSTMRFDSSYIDGNELYDQVLIHMKQLKKLTFNIWIDVCNDHTRVRLPSKKDVQLSFIGRGYQQVASHVERGEDRYTGKCHIYTLPYDFEYFDLHTSVQRGIFHKVRKLTIHDRIHYKHNVFKYISEDFPFLEVLLISDSESPKWNQKHSSTLITFAYLTVLDLEYSHIHYAESLLQKRNIYLPRLSNLKIKYKSLTTITNNFTEDVNHFNFNKLKSLDLDESFVHPENFHEYFPLL